MNRSELKQIIKEVIEESKNVSSDKIINFLISELIKHINSFDAYETVIEKYEPTDDVMDAIKTFEAIVKKVNLKDTFKA